VHNTNN